MLGKRNAQGLSITVIIAAVIGLIVLVVVVAILTGKLGGFSKGVDAASEDITKNCAEIGAGYTLRESISACTSLTTDRIAGAGGKVVTSKDAIASGKVCCTK